MKRNKVSLSNYKLLTCDMGQLIPINLTEILPGDTLQQATSALVRVSPLLAPVMHPVQVRIHHWFVPFRLIWDEFEQFITGGVDGNDNTTPPFLSGAWGESSLGDYLGLPSMTDTKSISALPFRAYQLICNEFYMDQDLQTPVTILKTSGLDNTDYNVVRRCCWEKDYFTSSRPWTQKGDDITLSIGSTADVDGTISVAGQDAQVRTAAAGGGSVRGFAHRENNSTSSGYYDGTIGGDGAASIWIPGSSATHSLTADLSSATSVTINQLREAFALQRYAEARAKYGSRYTEYLRYLGVNSSDARMNRPEYLGGGKQTIQFSEVLQTGGTSTGTQDGVGQMAGHGISAIRSNRYRRFFEEHGFIMTILSVRPKTIYQQGIAKLWTRGTREDFYQRELENIGQAEVLNQEVLSEHQTPMGVFGYQDRYDEYRRQESMTHGEFRTDLEHWHMARIFASEPALNDDFVTCTPTKRIHAVTNHHQLWIMANNSIQARRAIGV